MKNNKLNKTNNNNNKSINKSNNTSKTFIEIAQQQINNKKLSSQKNNKYIGVNNFITKSSTTNTYDDINSSHSIISKNNQIMDSIEEIHFNFVDTVQKSRNIMKMQENLLWILMRIQSFALEWLKLKRKCKKMVQKI